MSGPAGAVGEKVVREIGKRLVRLMVQKSGSRVAGHLARNSRVWKKAFKHIAEHFSGQVATGKASHAVFSKVFRSEAAVRELMRQAVTRPSTAPIVSKATISGLPIGKPVVIIERKFVKEIGKDHVGNAAHILRVVVDFTGRPLTAFPASSFFKTAAKKGAGSAAKAGGGAVAVISGAVVLTSVEQTYASERAAKLKRQDDACEPNGALEWIVDILISPSCIALDPPSRQVAERRAQAVIQTIQGKIGVALDPETRSRIREDVLRIWGH